MKVTKFFSAQSKDAQEELPLFLAKVSAGFPSPADDFIDQKLNLHEYLIRHKSATFFVRVEGESMVEAHIHSGDLLIVDRSLPVQDGLVIVAVLNGEFTVKQVKKKGEKLFLLPANPEYSPVEITEDMDFEVWGVVLHVIHSF